MIDVKTKSDSNKAISVQYTLVNEEKSHLEFIEQAPAAKRGFLKINSGQPNIFNFFLNAVLFFRCLGKCISSNYEIYLSNLPNIFVQIAQVDYFYF